MDKQELIEFLQENLKLEIETANRWMTTYDSIGSYKETTIKLVLGGHVISEQSFDQS